MRNAAAGVMITDNYRACVEINRNSEQKLHIPLLWLFCAVSAHISIIDRTYVYVRMHMHGIYFRFLFNINQ